jgi:putative hydrolase of the HAD superfamily
MKLTDIHAWVFDLDNTLYPIADIYDAIGDRMTNYIARAIGVDEAEALVLRERYFHAYGATVCGLTAHHGVDAHDFLAYVHDVDYAVLDPDPELADLIARLPGRKIIFTNGGGGHAQRALKRLGLEALFECVFDIESANLVPKPQMAAYECLLATCGLAGPGTVFVEDTLKNLEPAHALGFRTVLVGPIHPEPHPPYVDDHAPDLKPYLRNVISCGFVGQSSETR